jgi:spore germination cell wall hydrolase CwlJ-like protein
MDFKDALLFLTYTIGQEAGWESFKGKLAVGFVIVHRGESGKVSITDTIFKSFQFSCWNTESPTRMNIDTMPQDIFMECYKAACAAFFNLMEDPSLGATNYLNEEETRKKRGGSLPGWFDETKVTARIGRHTFLKL